MHPITETINRLPHTPGVYIYRNVTNDVIYVGKAVDLKRRVKQYFESTSRLSEKTKQLVSHISSLETIETVSEFDAILLEAHLIRTYQPKYNMIAKDDKSPIYIHIDLNRTLPILELKRKPHAIQENDFYFGPFQSSRMAKLVLRNIRKVVPYCTQKKRNGRPCFYTHIGLCHPCPSVIEFLEESDTKQQNIHIYRKNILTIKNLLLGKSQEVRASLYIAMKKASDTNEYEQAAEIRDHIMYLDNLLSTHFDPSIYLSDDTAIGQSLQRELDDLYEVLTPHIHPMEQFHRIECIDISNTSGQLAVGSLVVLTNGIVDTSLYRRFMIKTIQGQNDPAMIEEIVQRRLKHTEWTYPNLLVIDGGVTQVKAAMRVIRTMHVNIPCIGLAKRFETIVLIKEHTPVSLHIPVTRPAIHLLQRIRDESHRFALQYHTYRRAKKLIP